MSILAAAAASGDTPSALTQLIFAAVLVAVGLVVALPLGAFTRSSVGGPRRLAAETRVAGVFFVLLVGFAVWFGAQVVYLAMIRHRIPVGPNGTIEVAQLPPLDMALLATLPFIAGLVALMVGDRVVKSTLPRELGWSPPTLPRGIALGLLAMLAVLPLMFGAGIFLELLYRLVGYQHPTEHEMLTVLGRSEDRTTKYLIIGGATLLAPVFEEFLFRGHLQTVLLGVFGPRPRPAEGFPVMPPSSPAPLDSTVDLSNGPLVAAMMTPPLPDPAPASRSPAARWAAIAIASVVFTVLHPAWTWPLIFLLSLTLGYAYERTANLWVPVVMHLVFNSVQTAVFLISRSL